jgi:Ca2+/Na+ antiporter
LAVGAARWIYVSPEIASHVAAPALRLALAAAGYFLANTLLITLVISLTESVSVVRTGTEMFQLSFLYMLASAGVAGLSLLVGQESAWQVPLALLPIMLGVYLSYRRFFSTTAAEPAVRTMEASGAPAEVRI